MVKERNMNIFDLAQAELQREGKKATMKALVDRATKIRHFMDTHSKFTKHILNGGNFTRRSDGRLMIA
jgi:hypothetical protein